MVGSASVHPRVCGERESTFQNTHTRHGSSPRLRGTGRHTDTVPSNLRFIPASAGNGPSQLSSACPPSVHPRVCGERRGKRRLRGPGYGSSPRLRGTGAKWRLRREVRRFIPASAGNGLGEVLVKWFLPVHPRVCGERPELTIKPWRAVGSSPRLRGTARCTHKPIRTGRFIPASAGNGTSHRCPPLRTAVHPRVCGERIKVTLPLVGLCGSSPRLRGTGERNTDGGGNARFIPASAGNGRSFDISS